MPRASCNFPEHHRRGGRGFPWGLAVIVAGVVIAGSSTAFASAMHALMVIVVTLCAIVAVLGLGALWVLTGRIARTDHVPRLGRATTPGELEPVTAPSQPRITRPAHGTAALIARAGQAEQQPTAVHQHLHLHGPYTEQDAALIRNAIRGRQP